VTVIRGYLISVEYLTVEKFVQESIKSVVLHKKFISLEWNFVKIFISQRIYTVCTRINYKIVPVTKLNKYLHYGTSGTQ
jgi:hypothetical protein